MRWGSPAVVVVATVILLLPSSSCRNTSSMKKAFVVNAVTRYAVCNDFSPAAYYIRKQNLSKWIVHLESGGGCSAIGDCNDRYLVGEGGYNTTNDLMSSIRLPDTADGRDLLSPSPQDNPTFYDYSHVLLHYCSSDLWLGQGNHSGFPGRPFVFYNDTAVNDFIFRGLTIFRSTIEDLLSEGLDQATDVVLSGSSAGGVGVVNHVRWLKRRLSAAVTVSVIADSAWFIDFENNLASRSHLDSADELTRHRLLPECRDESRGYSCCLSVKCMVESTTDDAFFPRDVPLFLVVSVYDLYMLSESVKRLVDEDAEVLDYARTVALYGGAMNNSVENVFRLETVSHFMPACSQHVYLATSSLWEEGDFFNRSVSHDYTNGTVYFQHSIKSSNWLSVNIRGVSLLKAISDWYTSNFTDRQKHRDNCGGLLCNPSCPDKVEFKTPAIEWDYSIQLIVVILSVLLSVYCALTKIAMILYQHWVVKEYVKFNDNRHCFGDNGPCLPDCPGEEQMNVSCLNLDYSLANRLKVPIMCSEVASRRESVMMAMRQNRNIINSVSSYFNPGEIVAVMGPSGSGKTTLLDLLTGRRQEGNTNGEVLVNGCLRDSILSKFVNSTSYVLQLATPFYGELTVAQNLLYASILQLPKEADWEERFTRIHQVMTETGLTDLADTPVGGATGPGLSGGQKRRLSVALQLLSMPSVIFLDEPTSGLDASSSLELLRSLHCLAVSGRTVILTIHQPRLEIFHMFDKILFLCKGQVAYFGSPFKALAFFREAMAESDIAVLLKEMYNPADAIMDMLTNERAQESIVRYYSSSGEADAVRQAVQDNRRHPSCSNLRERKYPGLFYRVFALECRASSRQTVTKVVYLPILFILLGLLTGVTFWKTSSSLMVMSVFCIISCSSAIFISSIVMSLLVKPLEIFSIEKQDGVSSSPDMVIHVFCRLSAISILPVALCVIIAYFCVIETYGITQLAIITLIQVLLNQTWIAVFVVVVSFNPTLSPRFCPILSALAGFFSGFIVAPTQMPVYFRWMFPLNPTYWGYTATVRLLLQTAEFECPYKSPFECFPSSGLYMLQVFGIESANPYQTMAVLLGMIVASLLLSVIVLEARHTPRFLQKFIGNICRASRQKINKITPTYLPLRRMSRTPFLRGSESSLTKHSDDGYSSSSWPQQEITAPPPEDNRRPAFFRQSSTISALLDDDFQQHVVRQQHDVASRWETASIGPEMTSPPPTPSIHGAQSMEDLSRGSVCSLTRRTRVHFSRAVLQARKEMMDRHLSMLKTAMTAWTAGRHWMGLSRKQKVKREMNKSSSESTVVSTVGKSGRRFSVALCSPMERRQSESMEEICKRAQKRRRSVSFALDAKDDDDDDGDDDDDDDNSVFSPPPIPSLRLNFFAERKRKISAWMPPPPDFFAEKQLPNPLPRRLPSLATHSGSLPCLNETNYEDDDAVFGQPSQQSPKKLSVSSHGSRRASVPNPLICDFKISVPSSDESEG